MKINWELTNKDIDGVNSTVLNFEFSLDDDDKKRSFSNNVGRKEVVLGAKNCKFEIPFEIKSIHNDLIAFSALKIISPFIGSNFYIKGGVSKTFANLIKEKYKNIKSINVNESIKKYSPKNTGHAISFSGGVDSIAAALLDPKRDSYLILSHIIKHPDIKFIGRNTNAQKRALDAMADTFKKVVVKTNFPFITLSRNKKSTAYSDSFVFTLPIVLLSEHLGFNRIITGDILEAFTSNLTTYKEELYFESSKFHNSLGITIKQPLKGMSEIISTKIVYENGFDKLAVSCENSKLTKDGFNVCNKCMKCFRKGIFNWAVMNEPLDEKGMRTLEKSSGVKKLASLEGVPAHQFAPCYKWAFEKINFPFRGNFDLIKNKMINLDIDSSFVSKVFMKPYENEDELTISFVETALKYFDSMNEEDIENFKLLDTLY